MIYFLSSLVELPDKKVTMIRGSGADLSQYDDSVAKGRSSGFAGSAFVG